jgi:hypothetical protein
MMWPWRWWRLRKMRRRIEAQAAAELDEIAERHFPHVYVGPTTRFGLQSGTHCRILARLQGNTVRIQTPDGNRWISADRAVRRRGAAKAKAS